MTVKGIADVAGCSLKTAQRTAKRLFPEAVRSGRKSEFDHLQTIRILQALPKRNLVQSSAPAGTFSHARPLPDRFDRLIESLNNLTHAILLRQEAQESRIRGLEAHSGAVTLPAPEKSPRAQLNELVRRYVHASSESYTTAWARLYRDCLYRLGINFRERARRRGMDTLDYIEAEGYLQQVLLVAHTVFSGR